MSIAWLDKIQWTDDGLIAVIAQDINSRKVVMFAWMNRESLTLTQQTGYAVYWSRSRQRLWRKGEESGNQQKIISISVDCDADVILLNIEQQGGIACHTGRESCFYRTLENNEWVENSPVLKDPADMYNT